MQHASSVHATIFSMDDGLAEILERLARAERELERMRSGLSMLGIKRCSSCQAFFHLTDSAALFADSGESVCYGCIPAWWPARSETLDSTDRLPIEHRLVRWLVAHHNGRLIQQSHKLPEENLQEFRLLISCEQCEGTGKLLGGHCHYCGSQGAMWLVVPKVAD